jgi:hypothetical protein
MRRIPGANPLSFRALHMGDATNRARRYWVHENSSGALMLDQALRFCNELQKLTDRIVLGNRLSEAEIAPSEPHADAALAGGAQSSCRSSRCPRRWHSC